MCCWFIHNTNINIFINSVEFATVSGNLLCQLADHVLKDLIVPDRPKHEQTFECNYAITKKFPYLHIFTYSVGYYRGLIRLYFSSPLSLHCSIY